MNLPHWWRRRHLEPSRLDRLPTPAEIRRRGDRGETAGELYRVDVQAADVAGAVIVGWTCHVCGRRRPDALIGVVTREARRHGFDVAVNVRYCSDSADCERGALQLVRDRVAAIAGQQRGSDRG